MGIQNYGDLVTATGSTTPRSTAKRAADAYNLKDFGAVGDGVADDTAAMVAAIAFVGTLGGGDLHLGIGTFSCTHFTVDQAVRFIGAGKSKTIIAQAAETTTRFIYQTIGGVSFEHLTIQANANTDSGVEIATSLVGAAFQNAKVTGAKLYGVKALSTSALRVDRSDFIGNGTDQFMYMIEPTKTASDLLFTNSVFDGTTVANTFCSLYILSNGAGSSGSLTDIRIIGNQFKATSLVGAESDCLVLSCALTNADAMSRVTIADNIMLGTDLSGVGACYGIELASVTDFTVVGNVVEYCTPGIVVELCPGNTVACWGTIIGNVIRPGALSSGKTGIYIIAGQVAVVGNQIANPGYPAGYGIAVHSVADGGTDNSGTIVVGNTVYGGTSGGAGISIQSNDILIADNDVNVVGSGTTKGIMLGGTTRLNVTVRGNRIRTAFLGIYFLATNYTACIAHGNSFTGTAAGNRYSTNFTAAGVVIYDDSNGTYISTNLPTTLGRILTVATLPAASATLKGARTHVSDATAPTWLGALTGGGAVVCPVFCNGTAWLSG